MTLANELIASKRNPTGASRSRNPLTKGEQAWSYGLKKKWKSKLKFDLWNSTDAERLPSGDAEILRKTYFGELLLTPVLLAELHHKSVEPIRACCLPEAHQTVDAERTIRRMLNQRLAERTRLSAWTSRITPWDDWWRGEAITISSMPAIVKSVHRFSGASGNSAVWSIAELLTESGQIGSEKWICLLLERIVSPPMKHSSKRHNATMNVPFCKTFHEPELVNTIDHDSREQPQYRLA